MVNNRNQKNKNLANIFLKEYFSALVAVILILFLAVAYFIVLQPKFASVQDSIRSGLASEKSLAAASSKKLASYQAMSDIYKKINPADLQRFNMVLPDNYVPEKLFGEVEEILSRGGWLMNSLKIDRPKEEGSEIASEGGDQAAASGVALNGQKIGRYNLELSVAAIDYAGLKNLLKTFENNLRLFDVTKVAFSSSGATAQISLSTYYYQTQ